MTYQQPMIYHKVLHLQLMTQTQRISMKVYYLINILLFYMKYTKENLNQEILFNSRKQFGMYGNIQWHVTEISGNILRVQASSSRTDIDTATIGLNIVKSIQEKLPDARVGVHWIPWKPEHGKGVIVLNNGRPKEEITREIMTKLNN